MAKFILLLVFVCFQFSRQDDLIQTPDEGVTNSKISPPGVMLDGEDENQWYREKDEENWTEEDEKWFQQIQGTLKDSDEDYDDDEYIKTEKLLDEIEDWIRESHPEKSRYQWLQDIEKWLNDDLDDDDYDDYPEMKKQNLDDKDSTDLYYSWLYKAKRGNARTKRARFSKRFWSV